jgi:hypothetical protein
MDNQDAQKLEEKLKKLLLLRNKYLRQHRAKQNNQKKTQKKEVVN